MSTAELPVDPDQAPLTPKVRDTNQLRRIAIGIAIAVAVVVGYSSLLVYYRGESDARSSALEAGDGNAADRLEVTAWLVSVDQLQEQAVVRLNFEPMGRFADGGGALTEPIRLFLNSANASQDRSYDKGKLMAPGDVTIDLYDSSITAYPFDHFKAELLVGASTAAPIPDEAEAIPVSINFYGALHGLTVDANNTQTDSDSVVEINLEVSRSPTTLAIAWFIMLLLLAMALTVLVLTLSIVIGGRKLEPPIIGLLGALLFGFVAFRNSMPGAPPVGSLSDYIGFFWAEGIVAACLFTLVAVYLKRMPKPSAG